jgi:quinol monooxygenase YgiN
MADTSDSRVMIADLHGLAGRLVDLRSLLAELAVASLTEEGCESFRVLQAEDSTEIVLLSAWKDETALRGHYDTPHYRHYRAQVGPLLARPSDVTVLHVSETIHALDPNAPDPSLFD